MKVKEGFCLLLKINFSFSVYFILSFFSTCCSAY